jgi:hypothetical protein
VRGEGVGFKFGWVSGVRCRVSGVGLWLVGLCRQACLVGATKQAPVGGLGWGWLGACVCKVGSGLGTVGDGWGWLGTVGDGWGRLGWRASGWGDICFVRRRGRTKISGGEVRTATATGLLLP